ncbi:MAG: hypothetical protein GKR89_12570 [Candidatus Latescibacteria bacterium]|nr:hypothetical protein [Candidatus Latescibacterota bacterium]
METLHQLLRWTHVGAGFVGLVVFWIPVVVRKGGQLHKVCGRIFTACAYIVAGSAVLSVAYYLGWGERISRADQGFLVLLAYLALNAFVLVRHANRVVANRKAPESVDTPLHRILAWLCIAGSLGVAGWGLSLWSTRTIIFLALSPIGINVGRGVLAYLNTPLQERMGWFYEHMRNMLGAGIAFHTAFAVFGAGRLFGLHIDGLLGVLPWILPALIGGVSSSLWERRYRRRFDAGNRAAA